MAEKKTLTERMLKALPPAAKGKRYDVMDTLVPGFGVRVTDKGHTVGNRTLASHAAFILVARYPGSPNPTRSSFGQVGAMDLADAREKARGWLELIKAGIDPRAAEKRAAAAAAQTELQQRKNTFAAVAEDFIAEKLPLERKGKEVERDIRRDLIPVLGATPIVQISDLDILRIVNAKKKHAPAQARNLLGIARRMFAWAKDQRVYGLAVNPCSDLRPAKLIGDKLTGNRILSDDELLALWRAAKRMPYPCGPIYQVLMLTALRLNEAADASWPEIDKRNRLWTIPAERMKGKEGKARAHAVPLTEELLALLSALPRFKSGEYVFSATFGANPVWVSSKVKQRVDERMLRTLQALARRRGDNPSKVKLPPWKNHDIRRTVRSQLSRLKIAEEVREAVLAHVRPGIKGVYDLHDYLDEKREALLLWAARLKSIVEPPPNNVIALRA
jgi:integrase